MSSWLNRTTKEFIPRLSPSKMTSRHPADGPFVDGSGNAVSNAKWIWRPDVSAVGAFLSKYWIITGDVVTLMDQAARDAVDAQEEADFVASDRVLAKGRYDDRDLKALALIVLDEINILRAQHGLNPRTQAQLKSAHSAKVDTI